MVIVPDSKVILIKNPLKLDTNNELMFQNATAQYNYFTSLPKLEFDELTYVRKDGTLRIETSDELTFEDLLEYNFCMYQNTHFDNKWFYAFITDITWINPSLTEMKLETAYYQTWQHDLVFMDSYIEREHVNNDGLGVNLVDEGITPQEYVVDNSFNLDFFNKDTFKVIIAVSELVTQSGMENIPFVSTQGNVFCGMCFITPYGTNETAEKIVRAYDEAGHSDSIKYMFMAPAELIEYGSQSYGGTLEDGSTYNYRTIANNSKYVVSSGAYNKPSSLNGYTPKNKKMLQFPYCYLSVDTHSGNMYNFNYEDIHVTNNKYAFTCDGILSVGCSIKYTPVQYKTTNSLSPSSYTYGFTGIKFPTCGWVSDTYTNWLTQNAVNLGFTTMNAKDFGFISGIGSMLLGGASGNPQEIQKGISGVFNTLQTDYKASMLPDQVRGNENAGDINFSLGLVNPTINEMSIRQGQAKIIDDYFTMFGYKVNRLGKPHLHVRQYYDYIKTIDINIEGNIPEHDLNEIKRMFNNGIRFWHSTTYYLDFSVNNSII